MKGFFVLYILLFIFTFSCAPQKKLSPPPSQVYIPETVKPPKKEFSLFISDVISYAKIDNNIKLLENLLKNPDLNEREKKEISTLISNLNLIEKLASKQKISSSDTKKILKLLYNSFSLLEKEYISTLLLYKKTSISKIIKEITEKRTKIINAYQEKRYTDVINECLELKLKFGPDVVDPQIEVIFALSLGKIGMFREAIETGEKALAQISIFPDKEFLKSKLEEWKNIIKEAEIEEKVEVKEEKKEEEINIDLVISNVERLIKQENFEQALAILNEVKSKNEDIERLKNQAIEGIINRERNKAAKLFLLAKETEQKEKKLKYLEQSYRILEALIIQYPDSPLISRVRENLEKVAEEIKNLNIKEQ
jgi:hypothetical protein